MKLYQIFLSCSLLLFFAAAARPVAAQQGEVETLVFHHVDVQELEEGATVTIYASPFAADGYPARPPSGGSGAEVVFGLVEGDQDYQTRYPVEIEQASTPYYVVLLVDTSNSTAQALPAVREYLLASFEQMQKENRSQDAHYLLVGFKGFDPGLALAADFTTDEDDIRQRIRALGTEESGSTDTCLYNVVAAAADILKQKQKEYREDNRVGVATSIILFSDGHDQRGNTQRPCSSDESKAKVGTLSVPVFSFGLNTPAADWETLQNISRNTGGKFFSFNADGKELPELLAAFDNNTRIRLKQVILPTGKYAPTLYLPLGNRKGTIETVLPYIVIDRELSPPNLAVFFPEGCPIEPRFGENSYLVKMRVSNTAGLKEATMTVQVEGQGFLAGLQQTKLVQEELEFAISKDGLESGKHYRPVIALYTGDGRRVEPEGGMPECAEFQVELVVPINVRLDMETEEMIVNITAADGITWSGFMADGRLTTFDGDQIVGSMLAEQEIGQTEVIFKFPPALISEVERLRPGETAALKLHLSIRNAGRVIATGSGEFTITGPQRVNVLWIVLGIIGVLGLLGGGVFALRRRTPPITIVVPEPPRLPPAPAVLALQEGLPRATITVRQATKDSGRMIPLHHFPFWIGREGCDLNISDLRVSQRHAVIMEIDGMFYISDPKSLNGTFIDGRSEPLPRGRDSMWPLEHSGSTIRLGEGVELYFKGIKNS